MDPHAAETRLQPLPFFGKVQYSIEYRYPRCCQQNSNTLGEVFLAK
jgi:hypothetical protein